ncbi:hypothetical protein [Aquibium microcysteis]|uniref:hypothetical protein n=1 Tax=Aquibium microcysteis TaxID=675281 RepID=UPI00165D1479|nr:hypothetical protein [Aquibium microcysteis]
MCLANASSRLIEPISRVARGAEDKRRARLERHANGFREPNVQNVAVVEIVLDDASIFDGHQHSRFDRSLLSNNSERSARRMAEGSREKAVS